jgi:hypothetical protein
MLFLYCFFGFKIYLPDTVWEHWQVVPCSKTGSASQRLKSACLARLSNATYGTRLEMVLEHL